MNTRDNIIQMEFSPFVECSYDEALDLSHMRYYGNDTKVKCIIWIEDVKEKIYIPENIYRVAKLLEEMEFNDTVDDQNDWADMTTYIDDYFIYKYIDRTGIDYYMVEVEIIDNRTIEVSMFT